MGAGGGPAAASSDALLNAVLALIVLGILAWKGLDSYWRSSRKAAAAAARLVPSGAPAGVADADVPAEHDDPTAAESEHEVGEELELPVDDLHFGLPRCRIRAPGLESLPTMIKWAPENFDAFQLDVGRVYLGTFGVWVVQGMKSNRLLYAMKKQGGTDMAKCVVVEPPPPKTMEDYDNDTPDTYGTDLAKIQLIP
uniref:Uncharacterized protein n=1 Tax=Alexandrium monilatum TaxID=311494 RepID=A0A7S4S9X5_9DINO